MILAWREWWAKDNYMNWAPWRYHECSSASIKYNMERGQSPVLSEWSIFQLEGKTKPTYHINCISRCPPQPKKLVHVKHRNPFSIVRVWILKTLVVGVQAPSQQEWHLVKGFRPLLDCAFSSFAEKKDWADQAVYLKELLSVVVNALNSVLFVFPSCMGSKSKWSL